jgi:hypothetical protein
MERESNYILVLKKIYEFDENMDLHTLIACNSQEIALIHGMRYKSLNLKEYQIRTKVKHSYQSSP